MTMFSHRRITLNSSSTRARAGRSQGVLVVQVELVLTVTGLPVLRYGRILVHLAVAVLGEGSGREAREVSPREAAACMVVLACRSKYRAPFCMGC